MYCGKCGQELEEGSRFCTRCGNSVGQKPAYQETENKSVTENYSMMKDMSVMENESGTKNKAGTGKRSKTYWVVGVLLVVLILCGAGGLGYYRSCVDREHANQYYARVYKGGKWGYINLYKEEVISCRFDKADDFRDNGTAVVGKVSGYYEDGSSKHKYALINAEGVQLTEFKYFSIDDFQDNGLARVDVRVGSEDDPDWIYGYIDAEGNEVIECKYDSIGEFSSNGIVCAKIDGYAIFLDEKGNRAIEDTYEDAGEFGDNGLAPIEKDGYWGYIDEFGNVVIPCKYSWATSFEDSELARVENKSGKYGYIDSNGEVVIPFEFDYAYPFSEGVAVVSKGNDFSDMKYGLIDMRGNLILDYEFDYLGSFGVDFEGLAKAKFDRENGMGSGLINKSGEVVLPMEYELIGRPRKYVDGTEYGIVYREKATINGHYRLIKPEIINGKGEIVFSYEEYMEMLADSWRDVEQDGFLSPYGDNGWAVCGDGFYTYWFDEEGKVWLISDEYDLAGEFIKVR